MQTCAASKLRWKGPHMDRRQAPALPLQHTIRGAPAAESTPAGAKEESSE
jgi:hypothetical protein